MPRFGMSVIASLLYILKLKDIALTFKYFSAYGGFASAVQ